MHWYGSMWPMSFMMGGWLLLVALVVAAVVWLGPGRDRADPNETARRILAERFARGELDADEYTNRIAGLR